MRSQRHKERLGQKIPASGGGCGEGDKDHSPRPPQSSGSWRRQETNRRACWAGFLPGRQRTRAADDPTDPQKPEPDVSTLLGDLGGLGAQEPQRRIGMGHDAFVLGSKAEEVWQHEDLSVPTSVREVEQRT